MARKTRLYQKRKVAQARHDIERALGKIVALHDEFKSVHPAHAEYLEIIAKSLIFSQQQLERFWEISWGSQPMDWRTYEGDGSDRGG